jgi:hypothetical protein
MNTVWVVAIVLQYLKTLHPLEDLHLRDISDMQVICHPNQQYVFQMNKLLKTSTWETLQPFDATSITIFKTVQVYLAKTKPLRGNQHVHACTQLLISYQQPHKSVETDTIPRWLKTVRILDKPRINTNIFHAHSTIAASTSAAKTQNYPLITIMMTAAVWI